MTAIDIVLATSIVTATVLVPCASSAAVPYAASFGCRDAAAILQMKPQGDEGQDLERVIRVEQLPAAVYATLVSLGKGIEVKEVKENIDMGVTSYEIDLVHDNVYYEAEIDAQGNLTGGEVEAWIVSLESLPESARRSIEIEAGVGTIQEVRQEVEESGETVYEADIQRGARLYALRIDAHGNLIERDITMDMLPWGAYWALVCAAYGGSIVELDEEVHHGQLSYEANVVVGGEEFEISVDASGNIVELDF